MQGVLFLLAHPCLCLLLNLFGHLLPGCNNLFSNRSNALQPFPTQDVSDKCSTFLQSQFA